MDRSISCRDQGEYFTDSLKCEHEKYNYPQKYKVIHHNIELFNDNHFSHLLFCFTHAFSQTVRWKMISWPTLGCVPAKCSPSKLNTYHFSSTKEALSIPCVCLSVRLRKTNTKIPLKLGLRVYHPFIFEEDPNHETDTGSIWTIRLFISII